MRVAVAGGTGVVGKHVVRALRHRGDQAVVLTRSTGVDLFTGAGLDAGIAGCDAVVDVATVRTVRARTAVRYFETATTRLGVAAARAGVGHVVTLSIVGIEDVELGYYLGKLRQEHTVKDGSVPWTILRATQFHEFPGQVLAGVRGPVAPVPPMLSAPIAAAEVGEHLADLVHGDPRGMTTPIGGPQTLSMLSMAREYLAATGKRRLVVRLPFPARVRSAMQSGALVPSEPYLRGKQSFTDYLDTLRVPQPVSTR